MSEHDNKRFYNKKKFFKDGNYGRNFIGRRSPAPNNYTFKTNDSIQNDTASSSVPMKPVILKKREKEPNETVPESPMKINKEPESVTSTSCSVTSIIRKPTSTTTTTTPQPLPPPPPTPALPKLKRMNKSVKFMEDSIFSTDSIQEFIDVNNNDFIVVGVVGGQGVGKSTILNLLSHSKVFNEMKETIFKRDTIKGEQYGLDNITKDLSTIKLDNNKKTKIFEEIFNVEDTDDIENNSHKTRGIDIFITNRRMILLDCQPFNSISVLDELILSESKRSNILSEFIPLENSGEILGLQLTSFLMSVCHILIVVQDWFFDNNIIRYIQTAEMVKPTHSNPEDEYCDHLPHLLLIQNKATMGDFTPQKFNKMQKVYSMLFHKSKMRTNSCLGLGTQKLFKSDNYENIFNLFLIPEYDPIDSTYRGHARLEELVRKLRANLFGCEISPLTHIRLTEKTWLAYCHKVWENVRKSSFFVEYTKLMP